jgi:hypothetical protein
MITQSSSNHNNQLQVISKHQQRSPEISNPLQFS